MNLFGITVTSKMKHAALFAAAKKCGSVSALAKLLNVHQGLLGGWINLKDVPSFLKYDIGRNHGGLWWPQVRIEALEKSLYDLTGQTLNELFPPELCGNRDFLDANKTQEITKKFSHEQLSDAVSSRFLLPSPVDEAEKKDSIKYAHDLIVRALKGLNCRERVAIKMYFGIGGEKYTLAEIANQLDVTPECVRQILMRTEAKIKSKLTWRHPNILDEIKYD